MMLLPREHGAYGQLAVPLVTALGAAGVSAGGLLLVASAAAVFVAHEPVSILLGVRGSRARRELRDVAVRWLVCCAGTAAVAGTMALLSIPEGARWSLAVPAVPAILLGLAMMRGLEKSTCGEVAAAAAFAGMTVPVSMAAGAPPRAALAIALPFAMLFVTGTLAVRTVILRVRAGGNERAATLSRRSAFAVTTGGAACLASLVALDVLALSTLVAAAPGLVMALAVAARPPQATRLRTIGWTLVAASVLTAAVVIATV